MSIVTKARPRKNPAPRTVAIVSQAIKKATGCPTEHALWKSLPRRIAYGAFKKVIQHLIDENKIIMDEGHIVWVAADNPKLVRLLQESTPSSLPTMSNNKRGCPNA